MSFLRTSVLATMIVGAGLGTLSGVASAHESAPAAGCSNGISASNENGAGRTLGEKRPGEPARPGPDLDHGDPVQRSCGPRDAAREVEVEEEVLAERALGREPVRLHRP